MLTPTDSDRWWDVIQVVSLSIFLIPMLFVLEPVVKSRCAVTFLICVNRTVDQCEQTAMTWRKKQCFCFVLICLHSEAVHLHAVSTRMCYGICSIASCVIYAAILLELGATKGTMETGGTLEIKVVS